MLIEEIKAAVNTLQNGKIILFPSDIEWCYGCDATNNEAVADLLSLTSDKNLLKTIIIDNVNNLQSYVVDAPDVCFDLIEFAEKPLIIIYDKGKNLSALASNEDGSIAIKIIKNDLCESILQKFRKPILTIAANISHSNSSNLPSQNLHLKNKVGYIIENLNTNIVNNTSQTIMRISNDGKFKFIQK